MRPMANGIFVVPVEKELINRDDEGKKYPRETPMAIAKNIHRVKYLSKKRNFFLSFAGAQWFGVITIFFIKCQLFYFFFPLKPYLSIFHSSGLFFL
jgi:hypothetical protein